MSFNSFEFKIDKTRFTDIVSSRGISIIISSFEIISKSVILNFGDKNKSHILRTWNYISEINKYNEKANKLIKEPKRTMLFSFNESEQSIILAIILMVYLFLKILI